MEIKSQIKFGNAKIKDAYLALDSTRFQEKKLKGWLERAFSDLEKDAFCGIQIPKRLIPKEYDQRFGRIDNLWKYNLPNAWRLLYTVQADKIVVLSIVLDWMDHKDYELRFKY